MRLISIRSIYRPAKSEKRRILKFVFLQYRDKCTLPVPVTKFHAGNVEENASRADRFFLDESIRHEAKFGIGVDEATNESRAGNSIHMYMGAATPFHWKPRKRYQNYARNESWRKVAAK